jgi:hypothetical protein
VQTVRAAQIHRARLSCSPLPSGLGDDQAGGLLDGAPVGVDAPGTDRGAFQGIGVCCRLAGDSAQVRGGLPEQRVARLSPAAALPEVHDPAGQLITSGGCGRADADLGDGGAGGDAAGCVREALLHGIGGMHTSLRYLISYSAVTSLRATC